MFDLREVNISNKWVIGTSGAFIKKYYINNGKRYYAKTSRFDTYTGFSGFEVYYEVIASRLAKKLGVSCVPQTFETIVLSYRGIEYITDVCISESYRKETESKVTFEDLYEHSTSNMDVVQFAKYYMGNEFFQKLIMFDFIIFNRDRHGANMEFYKYKGKIIPAPLFDNGLSFFFSCPSDIEIYRTDVMEDRVVNNYIGYKSLYDNLKFLDGTVRLNPLTKYDKSSLFRGLTTKISKCHRDKIWEQIVMRYKYVTEILDKGQVL